MRFDRKRRLIAIAVFVITMVILGTTIPIVDCYPCWKYLHTHWAVGPGESGRVTHTLWQLIRCRTSTKTWIEQRDRADWPELFKDTP